MKFAWHGRWPVEVLGGAAEAEAAEADQAGRTDQNHAEGGGLGHGEGRNDDHGVHSSRERGRRLIFRSLVTVIRPLAA